MKTIVLALIIIFFCFACRENKNDKTSPKSEIEFSTIEFSGRKIMSVRELMSALLIIDNNISDDVILSRIEYLDTEAGVNHYSIISTDILFTVKHFSTADMEPHSPALLTQKVSSIESDDGSRTLWRFQADKENYKKTYPPGAVESE